MDEGRPAAVMRLETQSCILLRFSHPQQSLGEWTGGNDSARDGVGLPNSEQCFEPLLEVALFVGKLVRPCIRRQGGDGARRGKQAKTERQLQRDLLLVTIRSLGQGAQPTQASLQM